jgi:hypothetical protein
MDFTIDIADIIAILSAVLGVGSGTVLTLKSKGLITFGKPVERRQNERVCMGHQLFHDDIQEIKTDLKETRTAVADVNLKFEKHLSFHAGKNGYK